jgi:hypothetical protein
LVLKEVKCPAITFDKKERRIKEIHEREKRLKLGWRKN